MAQNDWSISISYANTPTEGLAVFHSDFDNPLTVGGTYCRYFRTNSGGGTDNGFMARLKHPSALSIPDTKAISVRSWVRHTSHSNNQYAFIFAKDYHNSWDNTSAASGYHFGIRLGDFYFSAKGHTIVEGFDADPILGHSTIDRWVHVRMDVIPIKHNGVVIMDHVKCYTEVNNEWVLVVEKYIESTDSIFVPWQPTTTDSHVGFGHWVWDYWQQSYWDKFEVFTETVEQPEKLTLSLTNDTGPSNSDRVTSDPSVTVSAAEVGATRQYSTDLSNWGAAIPSFTSGSNTLYARQVSAEGRTSPIATLQFTYIPDDTHLSISSATSASVVENVGLNNVVYTAEATNEFSEILYSLKEVGDHAKFSIDTSSGQVTLLENPDFETSSSYSFTFQALDLAGFQKEQEVSVSVVDDNEAPSFTTTFSIGTQETPVSENASLSTVIATLSATDPESDAVTFTLVSQSVPGTFELSSSSLVLTGTLDYETNQTHAVTLRASDAEFDVEQQYTVYVSDVNETPTLSLSLSSDPVSEDTAVGTVIGTLSGIDPENDSLTFSIVSQSPSGSFEISGSDLKVASALDYGTNTSHSLTLRASDGINTVDQSVSIDIGNVNDSDPNFSDVSLLLKMDGSNGSTTFTDDSSNSLTIVANGNSQISTTENKFGGASGYFDGTGDYLQVPYDDSLNLGSGSTDWTVETWIRMPSIPSSEISIIGASDGGGSNPKWMITANMGTDFLYSANKIGFVVDNGGNQWINASHTWQVDTWYHIAVVHNSGTTTMYVDGTSVGSYSYNAPSVSSGIRVASDGEGYRYFPGYMDDVRITKGTARYTSNFAPPGSHPIG